jgi:hypothetical protein
MARAGSRGRRRCSSLARRRAVGCWTVSGDPGGVAAQNRDRGGDGLAIFHLCVSLSRDSVVVRTISLLSKLRSSTFSRFCPAT